MSQTTFTPQNAWEERYQYLKNIQNDKMNDLYSNGVETAADFFELFESRYKKNPCLQTVHSDSRYTYEDVNIRANIIAHWIEHRLSNIEGGFNFELNGTTTLDESLNGFPSRPSGERVIGLLMENRPSFIITWLGIAKLGYTVSCYNHFTDITWHVYISKAPYVIISTKQKLLWENTVSQLKENGYSVPQCWIYEEHILPFIEFNTNKLINYESQLVHQNEMNIKEIESDTKINDISHCIYENSPRHQFQRKKIMNKEDPVFHIFTSGTTGRSKAACFSNRRFYGAGVTWSSHMHLKSSDNYYIPLPLFHGNGGVVAVAACIISGCNMVIRDKFSASNTLSDIRKYNCTAMIYIGELWRYIYNQPPNENDGDNPLRVVAGNGLRSEIWEAVQKRFKIESIVEHYGQTEMISAHPTINSYGKVGSCGFIPPSIWNNQNEDILIKYNVEKDEVYRDPITGFCERVPIGSPGECISILNNGVYRGYTNEDENQKKIYRNVFKQNDAYFRSGDLLQVDNDGFFYFVDRAGDTYRWKGENISTIEVTKALEHFPNLQEINVFGVHVPNHEGKAGMACVQMKQGNKFDPKAFYDWVIDSSLPHYAFPYIIRVLDRENPKTSTLKFQKYSFSKEGFDPRTIHDILYFGDFKNQLSYIPLTEEIYFKIINNEFRM